MSTVIFLLNYTIPNYIHTKLVNVYVHQFKRFIERGIYRIRYNYAYFEKIYTMNIESDSLQVQLTFKMLPSLDVAIYTIRESCCNIKDNLNVYYLIQQDYNLNWPWKHAHNRIYNNYYVELLLTYIKFYCPTCLHLSSRVIIRQ